MHIQIIRNLGLDDRGFPPVREFEWKLVKADGEVVCQGPDAFATEREARSQIADAKRSMKGASRVKVLSP